MNQSIVRHSTDRQVECLSCGHVHWGHISLCRGCGKNFLRLGGYRVVASSEGARQPVQPVTRSEPVTRTPVEVAAPVAPVEIR